MSSRAGVERGDVTRYNIVNSRVAHAPVREDMMREVSLARGRVEECGDYRGARHVMRNVSVDRVDTPRIQRNYKLLPDNQCGAIKWKVRTFGVMRWRCAGECHLIFIIRINTHTVWVFSL